jgi:hypothetical protein
VGEATREVVLSFDLPADYTVTSQSDVMLYAEGPVVAYSFGPEPAWLSAFCHGFWSAGTPREAAYESVAEYLGDHAGPILAEGPLTVGEFEGYAIRVRRYVSGLIQREEDYSTVLVLVVRVREDDPLLYPPLEPGADGYVGLWTAGSLDVISGTEYFLETGEPLAQWYRRGFDAIVGSLAVSAPPPVTPTSEATPTREREAVTPTPERTPTSPPVTPTPEPTRTPMAQAGVSKEDLGPPQTEFVASVPGPDEISTDPEVIGTNVFLALFVILAFAFTSTLFNQTLDENRRQIEGWVGRFFAPFQRLTRLVEQRYGIVAERRPWVQRVVGPAVILVLTGLIYGFLSPDFGFNTKSVVLFVSMLVGVGAVTYLYKGGQVLFTTRRLRLRAGVKLYAVALAIAGGSVLLSRLVDFQPGFLFGFVASYTLLAPAALDRRQSGQVVLFPAIALLVLSIIAWLLVIPLREVTEGSDAWWVALPEGAAVAVFVVGLEGLFFNMIPLSFMDGAKIAEWNRLLWFLMFGVAGFLFWHVLLNQEGAYLDVLPEKRVIAALGLLAFYSIVTLGTWAYFRRRVEG